MLKQFICLAVLIPSLAFAQKKEEVAAIKNLCGCFEVEFMYAETFSTDTAYQFKDRYHAKGLEWVTPIKTNDNSIVLQHLLVVDDSTIVKHWREDWAYQQTQWLVFDKNATWKKEQLPADKVKGQWTQTVWEVDDAPRYQGSGHWINNDGKYYWENTADAPLPRREYTKRNDYNVMRRGNRVIVSDKEWIHEQDNQKVLRADGKPDQTLVLEKGFNIYRRVAESRCKPATDWWALHQGFWEQVRKGWDVAINSQPVIQLKSKVDGKSLGRALGEIEKNNSTAQIPALIQKYLQPQGSTASN